MHGSEDLRSSIRLLLDRMHETDGPIAMVVHRGADPDAIASAFALKVLAERLNPRAVVRMMAPGGLNRDGRRLSLSLKINFHDPGMIDQSRCVILVDTTSLNHASVRLEDLARGPEVFVVDHHDVNYPDYVRTTISDIRKSTSEIVLTIYDEAGQKPDRLVAEALTNGIVYDTAGLTACDNGSILALSRLVQEGVDVEGVLASNREVWECDERIARIRAAQRVRVQRLDDLTIGMSRVGSYNSSASSALISIGFDLAVVITKDKGSLAASVRVGTRFVGRTGLSVGRDICEAFVKLHGGSGGGHRRVGIIRTASSEDEFFRDFLDFLREKVGGHLSADAVSP